MIRSTGTRCSLDADDGVVAIGKVIYARSQPAASEGASGADIAVVLCAEIGITV